MAQEPGSFDRTPGICYCISVYMFLYHGSNVTVDKPQLIGQTRGLDFGPGFYLTTSEKQAAKFSETVFKRKKSGSAIVNVYEFDMSAAENTLAIQKFGRADAAWLRFVAENRLKIYQGSEYDMVIGAVANDTLMPTIQAYLSGFISEEATLVTLRVKKLVDQVCLKTGKALFLLNFISAYDIRNKESQANE